MTKIYFVRHAEPIHSHVDDRTRPLTEEGISDTRIVLETLKDKDISAVYCSPYKRSIDTIQNLADYFKIGIQTDERLQERVSGVNGNVHGMFQRRWEDRDFHEEGGESINLVQQRNIEALIEILKENEGKNIVIGTHGTALSSIINYYNKEFCCKDFLRIINWMPYIVEMVFDGQILISSSELAHIEKEYTGR